MIQCADCKKEFEGELKEAKELGWVITDKVICPVCALESLPKSWKA